jgi:branched-chain amino acid transport system permease protein/urea transport system permease protein
VGAAATAALWLFLLGMPLVTDDWQLTQLAQFLCYGIFAMSLSFVWGQAGMLCFGQAVFFGLGGYLMALITKGMIPGVGNGMLTGLFAAALIPALVAGLAGQLLFRGRGLAGAYFAIVTLAAAVIVERIASHIDFIGGFNGLMNVPPLRIGVFNPTELIDAKPVYYVLLAVAAILFAVLLWLERSALGTVLRAIRDNDRRTAYFGHDVAAYKTFAFTVSAAVAGFAGALFVSQFGFVSPALIGAALSTEVLIWVALGGREVLLAAFLGAIVVRWIEGELSAALGSYWLLTLGLLFVIAVVFLPRGLLGWLLKLPMPRRLNKAAMASTWWY